VLSTTSFAVLGMLAIRPWSAYELTKQMRRSLGYCWPKAESVLYEEPKRLVALSLAAVTDEPVGSGSRTRAVYAITDAGRAELRRWLASEPAPPRFEFEPLLRLLYADAGRKADVLRAVGATQTWAREEMERGLEQLEDYRETGGPFPHRMHIIVLFGDLVARLLEAVGAWAVEAEDEITTWPRTSGLGMTAATAERLDGLIEHAHAVLARMDNGYGSAPGVPG
jgi:PadR family transcriptional regulator, regulatory protein AphA